MNPATLELSLILLEALIKATPQVAIEIQKILSKPDPTAEDWAALRAKVIAKSYDDYVNPPPPIDPPVQSV